MNQTGLAPAEFPHAIDPRLVRQALDPERLRAPLARFLGLERDQISVTVLRTHFSGSRPPTLHCRVASAAGVPDKIILAEILGERAEDHADSEILSLSKARRAQLRRRDSGAVMADPETGLVFRRPGLDAKLRGLRMLHEPACAAEAVAETLRVGPGEISVDVALRAHRLGKRAVLQLDVEGARKVRLFARLRTTSSDSGAIAYSRHQEIAARMADAPGIAVPRPLRYDPGLGAAFFDALPGHPPSFDPAEARTSATAIAGALGTIQARGPATAKPYGVSDELAMLHDRIRTVRAVLPELAPLAEDALQGLENAALGRERVEFRPCHRDFHMGQILLHRGCAGVLDFDTYCLADPALDAGNMIAHLRMAALEGNRGTRIAEQAFRHHGPAHTSAGDVEFWTRAALLRLGCLQAFTSHGRALAAALLREAAG